MKKPKNEKISTEYVQRAFTDLKRWCAKYNVKINDDCKNGAVFEFIPLNCDYKNVRKFRQPYGCVAGHTWEMIEVPKERRWKKIKIGDEPR